MMSTFNDIVCRYHSKFSNSMGRWSTVSLTGRAGHIIHFVTVYQVVAQATPGPFTAYQQQLSTFQLADQITAPREAFIVNLLKYLKDFQTPTAASS
jgi:hypothetical protein